MARPSPRTQGVTEEGETFQKFGTQQLKFVEPPKLGTPYQGVKQIDTGKTFKMITSAPIQAIKQLTGLQTGTVFSQRMISGITGATPVGATYIPPPSTATPNGGTIDKHGCECEACMNGTGQCSDKNPKCNAWDLSCEMFGAIDKHGCECEACKNGTGQCSDKRPECDSWDLACELGGGMGDIASGVTQGFTQSVTSPVGSWWDKYGIWVYVILGVIGLGILLWLLRPLFGFAKSVTQAKSAVTRVNGLK